MKKIILIAIIALTTFNTDAQFKRRLLLDGLFLDLKLGSRFGGETSNNVTLNPGFNIQGGFGYMFSRYLGIKGDLGFNTLKTVDVTNIGSTAKGSIIRLSLEGVVSISELAKFGIPNFGLNLHAGAGIATIANKDWKATTPSLTDPFLKGNDDVINFIVGLNPQFEINENIALDLDFSYNMLTLQDHTVDRAQDIDRGGMTGYSTLSLGLTYRFTGMVIIPSRFRKAKRQTKSAFNK
jgi:hypothetical protein